MYERQEYRINRTCCKKLCTNMLLLGIITSIQAEELFNRLFDELCHCRCDIGLRCFKVRYLSTATLPLFHGS